MARVLAKSVLSESREGVAPMALELAQAIEECHAGDHRAIPRVLAKAMEAAELGPGRREAE
jgi:hypothetical protein